MNAKKEFIWMKLWRFSVACATDSQQKGTDFKSVPCVCGGIYYLLPLVARCYFLFC